LNQLFIRLFASAMDRFAIKKQILALEMTISLFLKQLSRRSEDLFGVFLHFSKDHRWILRYLAGRELVQCLPANLEEDQVEKDQVEKDQEKIKQLLEIWLRLAGDEKLYVREGVAKGIVSSLHQHFDLIWPFWVKAFSDTSDKVRQTAAMTLIPFVSGSLVMNKDSEQANKGPKERVEDAINQVSLDSSTKVKAIYDNYIAPHLPQDQGNQSTATTPTQKIKTFQTTAELPISKNLIDQVVGQEEAVRIIKLAARQKRSVLLIGEPGTGKSLLGQAMANLLPISDLQDILVEEGIRERNVPSVRVVPSGDGEAFIQELVRASQGKLDSLRFLFGFSYLVALTVALFYTITKDNPFYFIAGVFGIAILYWVSKGMRGNSLQNVPKLLVNNKNRKKAPFIDATGLGAGALLGDVRHDPYQSGGMETKPHHLVEPGAIHLAHQGVLFIDEVSTLSLDSQQALLSAFQEKKLAITGRSQGSSGAMIRTASIPSDFLMVLAGNLPDVEKIHPALRSRIRGYGYEVYTNDSIPDTEWNRYQLSIFIAQEVRKDGRIPHFSFQAVQAVIDQAKRMAEHPNRLTARFRELGGMIRSAGDIAVQSGASLVEAFHVEEARQLTKTLEEQKIQREQKKLNSLHEGPFPGKIQAFSTYKNTIGNRVQIWSEVFPYNEVQLMLSLAAKDRIDLLPIKSALYRYGLPGKYFIELEGVDQDWIFQELSLAIGLSSLSSAKKVKLPETVGICGVLHVNGQIGACTFFEKRVTAAEQAGIQTMIAPLANMSEVTSTKIQLVWVQTLDEAWEACISLSLNEAILS
jgi:Lon-like ATP-dependent protease